LWRRGVGLKTVAQRVFSATPGFGIWCIGPDLILGHGPTANQKSDVSAAHTVMPTSSTTQSKGVNPNSLPSLMTYAIVAA